MKKRTRTTLFSILIISVLIIGSLFAFGIVGQTTLTSGTYINVPTFGYYECAPASEKVATSYNSISSSGTGFITCPSNSESCLVQVRVPDRTLVGDLLSDYRVVSQVCNINTGNCESQKIISVRDFRKSGDYYYVDVDTNLLKSEKIWIDYQKKVFFNWKGIDGSQYRFEYKPFILWKTSPFSGRNEYSSIQQGCSFTSTERPNLVDSTTLQGKLIQTSTDDYKLNPYKTRNFIENFVPISVENYKFVNYNGQEGYCINGQIYKIDTVTTNSGTYKIVNVGVNPLIANLECCPGDDRPGYVCENYKWKKITTGDGGETNLECSLFKPCPQSNWEIKSSKTLNKFDCVNGFCVERTQTVECTDNSHCIQGEVCDTKTYTCEVLPGGGGIIDKDTPEACAKLAERQPWLGWTYIETTKKPSLIKKIFTLGFANEKTIGKCKATFLIYYIIGGIVLFLGTIGILYYGRKKKGGKRRK